MTLTFRALLLFVFACALAAPAGAQTPPRARDLGIPFSGQPGPLNAITDVAGVEVGHATIVRGDDIRTGATTIFPRGRRDIATGVTAAVFDFNGTGELTGSHLIDEIGAFYGPVVLTGTTGVGAARDGVQRWVGRTFADPLTRYTQLLPVIGETYDGGLSDAWRMALTPDDVVSALEGARGGPVQEGSVGGGTGMVCFYFKCGIGTSSRVIDFGPGVAFTVGVLVQANHGVRDQLTIAGVPVGREIGDLAPRRATIPGESTDGSIIIIVATDAPLLPNQMARLARRATIGLGRTGAQGDSGSGDIFLAFTTANPVPIGSETPLAFQSIPNEALDPLFDGVVQATEEAIINALVAGRDMNGRGNSFVYGMPHARVRQVLRRRGVLRD